MVTTHSSNPGPGPAASDNGPHAEGSSAGPQSAREAMDGGTGPRTGSTDGSEFTMTIPTGRIFSTAATAVLTPVAVARRVLPAKGGLPLYAGLGGLALIGALDWPVAVAAGAGYGLARLVGFQEHRPADPWSSAARHQEKPSSGAG